MNRRTFMQLAFAAFAGGFGLHKVTSQPPMPPAGLRTKLSPSELEFFDFLEGFHAKRGTDIGHDLADIRDKASLSKDRSFIDRLYAEHLRRRRNA